MDSSYKKQFFNCKIVEKNMEKGWFLKTYIVTIQCDELNGGTPFPIEVNSNDYYSMVTGQTIGLAFISNNGGKNWNISRG